MNLDTPLTTEGRARLRKAVVEYESWGYERRRDALREELGAERFSKSHVYTLPCIHDGRRHAESGRNEAYVLKVCSTCANGEYAHWERRDTANCFLDSELGVWETAVRHGDDDLFCPILDAEQREGWMIMEQCDHLSALPDDHPYDDLEVLNSYHANQCIARRLQERGWLPSSFRTMDVEAMVLDDRLVAIDYESIYHIDWMYDPLSWHRSPALRRDTPHTAAAVLARDIRDAEVRGHPGPSRNRRRALDGLHYTKIRARREAESVDAGSRSGATGRRRRRRRRRRDV